MNLLIFGGGELQLSIINVAKKMGIRTIVIDPNPEAPAKEIADIFEVVGGEDFKGTVGVCHKYDINGIVTAATDKPLKMMARVAEALSYTFPSYDSIINTIDKYNFKKKMLETELPVAKGLLIDSFSNELKNLKYPVVVKPVDNSGSRGVIKVEKFQFLEKAIKEALQSTREKGVLVEEFIKGDEISVEALVVNGRVHIVQITDKITSQPPYNVEIAQIQPSKYYKTYQNEILELLQNAINKLQLNSCALHAEIKINEEGIFIIEIGPRLGGDFITSHLVPLSTGISIEKQMIQIALNMPVKFINAKKNASMIKYFQLPVGKKITYIKDLSFFKNDPYVYLFSFSLNVGDLIPQITNSLNRYGYVILKGNTVDELIEKSKDIENQLYSNISMV